MSNVEPFQRISQRKFNIDLLRRVRALEALTDDSIAVYEIKVFSDEMETEAGDGKFFWTIPADLDGLFLYAAQAGVSNAGTGPTSVQVNNTTAAVDMLSTKITIDTSDLSSYTSATPSVVNVANAEVNTADLLRLDVDDAGAGSLGLHVMLALGPPAA